MVIRYRVRYSTTSKSVTGTVERLLNGRQLGIRELDELGSSLIGPLKFNSALRSLVHQNPHDFICFSRNA